MQGKKAKYIVISECSIVGTKEKNIYPFSDHIMHKEMANKLGYKVGSKEILSAGFIQFNEDGPVCYGHSISLNLMSREEDSMLAEIAFGE